jgi:ATP-dependent Clp protease ATP-binding subunit ClpC
MFERFTDRARRVVVLAQEEARVLNHNHIGTEHVLLGLIREGEGVAAQALESLGIKLDAVRYEVEQKIGRGTQSQSGHIPFTPRAKKALELSLREALQLNHNYIGTEHILLGVIREGEGVAAQVLVRLGGDLSRVRSKVVSLLQEQAGGDEPARRFTAGRGWERGEFLKALNAIHDRLSAIERHLGITSPPAAQAAAGQSAEGEPGGAAGTEPGPPAERGPADEGTG